MVKVAVEERSLEVDLPTFPVFGGHQTQDEAESWGEHLVVVKSAYLSVARCYQASFELVDRVIGTAFDLEHPLGLDDFPSVGAGDQTPGRHAEEGGKFVLCGAQPLVFVGGFKKLTPRLGCVYISRNLGVL